MDELTRKRCVPCEGGVACLTGAALEAMRAQIGEGWRVVDGRRLEKEYGFDDFKQALDFVNRVGAIAEEEGHHPEVYLGWGKVKLTLWTHAIDGLSENDFILAAKADATWA